MVGDGRRCDKRIDLVRTANQTRARQLLIMVILPAPDNNMLSQCLTRRGLDVEDIFQTKFCS